MLRRIAQEVDKRGARRRDKGRVLAAGGTDELLLLVVQPGDAGLEELVEVKGAVCQKLHAARLAQKPLVESAKLARKHVKVEGVRHVGILFAIVHEWAKSNLGMQQNQPEQTRTQLSLDKATWTTRNLVAAHIFAYLAWASCPMSTGAAGAADSATAAAGALLPAAP